MILNKAAVDRGLGRGMVYKTEMIDLRKTNPPQSLGADLSPPPPNRKEEDRPATIFGQRFPQNVATPVSMALVRSHVLALHQRLLLG